MLWPFSLLKNWRSPSRGTIQVIYGMIVAQAREPAFYRDFNVPDTVNGRLDLLILHLWLVLRRLTRDDTGTAAAQVLFDHFCADMDANLREMGVGDLAVPKRMKKFGEAFYGRSAAYDLAMSAGVQPLAEALLRNVFDGASADGARRLADYVLAAKERLASVDDAKIFSGAWSFPQPAVA